MKRIISFLLSLIFIFSTLPLSALKISASPFMGGDGSEANPYLVGSPEALDAVRNNLTAHYQQTCDIDMSAWGNWVPIEDFKGVYDGREFEIKGITIVYSYKVSEATPYGLFATAQGASFKNIRLADLNIDIDEAETAYEAIYASGLQAGIVVGGICADAGNPVSDYSKQSYTLFENCTVSGNIRIMNCADVTVGGIVGRGFADISYCNNYANITVNANRMYDKNNLYNLVQVNCGGICGKIDNLQHSDLYSKATRYCSNSGKIEVWSGGYTAVAGIGFSFNIRECVNFGNIFASATEEQTHIYSTHYVGGISATGGVSSCVNYGIISGCGKKIKNDSSSVGVGGICGRGRAEGCFNLSPSISAQHADQYNITSYANSAGRISGQNYYDSQSSVAYSYSSNQTKVNDTVPEPHTYESSGYGRNYNYRNGFDLTHEELLLEKTYGFDFKNTWIIDPSVGGPVLRNVSFVVDDDIPVIEKLDFAEYKYRADYLLSTTLTEAPFLTTLTTNEYNPAKIIVDSHPKGMNSAAAAWDAMNKAITAVNDGPGELIKDDITQRNMITAYIMQALKYQSRDIIADAIKTGASDWEGFVGLSEYIVNGFDGSTENFADHAKSHRTEIQKALLEQSQKTDSPMQKLLTLKEFASLFDTLAGVCKDYNDLYNRINSYAMLYASTEETKAVINSMYELCPTSDTEIKLALGAAKEIMTAASDELLKKFINGEIFFTTLTTTSALMADLLWDQVNEVLAASFPGVAALCMLANAEMYVVDKFFGVSKSVEQYFKLCTIADLDALAGKVVEKAIEDYRNERTTENAKVLLGAIELKFGFIQESYSESIKYAEIINDEGIVRSAINALKMFLDIYDNSLKNSLQSGVVVIDEFHKNILTSWIYQLEYDYPLIAPLYDEYKNGINKSFTSKQCSVHCPVNITVYDAAGEIVAEVGEDNVWSSGKIAVVYDHGEKEIYFFDNAEYRIVCEGYDTGDMDISVTDYDSDGNVTRTVNYNNVPVSSGSLHTLSEEKVTDGEGATLEADYDSSADAPKNNITIKYGVISGYLFETQAAKGERIEISAIIPEGYRFVGWVGEVEFEDKKSASTYFFMPDGDVNISARLKKIENGDNDDKSNSGTPIIIIIAAAGGGIIFLGGVAVLIVAFNEKRKNPQRRSKMKPILYNYDIYPKVFLGDREQKITIQPLGLHSKFIQDQIYTVRIFKVSQSNPSVYPERSGRSELTAEPDCDGCLRFSAFFEGEGEHFINIYDDPAAKPKFTLSVYSLEGDMAGRLPFRGDLHMHTCRSDGKEGPANVAANYRAKGYDFTVISDHHRYYPSLEAIEAYGDLTDLAIIQGEEVHLPLNNVHYVNFGGTYSINALITPSKNEEKAGQSLKYRSSNGNAPETMTVDEFKEMIRERAKSVPREHEAERLSYAVLEWTHEQVQAAGGLGIFPHPYWLCQMMQLPEDYTEFVYKNQPFDAFEVLGGENIFSHNGFQTAFYYTMKAQGYDAPVVGSTDSHGSTEHNRNGDICSTIVFAKANERVALIDAIKEKYSLAVDTISKEYRLVGDFRLIKYGSFLMENYFPLHDLMCEAEGYYMNRYINGDPRAVTILKAMKGQQAEMMEKYFKL